MGMCSENRSIRAKTREAMRGAMSAAAHVFTYAERTAIRDRPEQCRGRTNMIETLTENAEICRQGSGTPLDVPTEIVMAHPSCRETKYDIPPHSDELGGNRGEPGGKAIRYGSPHSRSDPNMVARSVGYDSREKAKIHDRKMQISVKNVGDEIQAAGSNRGTKSARKRIRRPPMRKRRVCRYSSRP